MSLHVGLSDIGQLRGGRSCPFLQPPDFFTSLLPRGVSEVPEATSEVWEEILRNENSPPRELPGDKGKAGVSGLEKRLLPGEVGL